MPREDRHGTKLPEDLYTIHELAELFQLPALLGEWDRSAESHAFTEGENAVAEAKDVAAEDDMELSEDDIDQIREKAEEDERSRWFHRWYESVRGVLSEMFEAYDLELVPAMRSDRKRYDAARGGNFSRDESNRRPDAEPQVYRIRARPNWRKAAQKILAARKRLGLSPEDMSFEQFIGPDMPVTVALLNIPVIARHHEAYRGPSPERLFWKHAG